ncbi:hypothetical protein [uncultured Mycolicibacterium sp.]|uniref:hypothetical protein n=1 Tax=uncultured Mycolicibacterium sp. TaxID=2320817 RepID=UPI00261EA60F|nr:hypothetical protein [uncultured Mycolicibacterium sp.]
MALTPADEDEYTATRERLLDDFARWLGERHDPVAADEVAADAGLLLDWRFYYSNRVLDGYEDADLTEFLLEYCPQQVSLPAAAVDGLCWAVSVFIEFLADTGRLAGGLARAARLMTLCGELVGEMRTAMADSDNFGLTKTLLAGLDVAGLTEEELEEALAARMAEFNSLPYEQRKALTDQFFDEPDEPHELPFLYLPPTAAELEAAAATPLLAKVEALREYLGADGKPLTKKGNLRLADGRALVALLGTGDEVDRHSTAFFEGLGFVVLTAREAGAVRVLRQRLVPVHAWDREPAARRARRLAHTVLAIGVLGCRGRAEHPFVDELDGLLDEGVVHWLAPLLAQDTQADYDRIVEIALAASDRQLGHVRQPFDLADLVEERVSRIFDTLRTTGVVAWDDRVVKLQDRGCSVWVGGQVRLTALGREIVAEFVPDAGYVLRTVDDLAAADGAALIEALVSVAEDRHAEVIAAWQPDRTPAERTEALVTAIGEARTAAHRIGGFVALEHLDPQASAPMVRQLLDSPAGGHAALWLIQHGLADTETVGGFVHIGVLVDILGAALDDPAQLCRLFVADRSAADMLELLEQMWRCPAAETAEVLDTLGRHLPDAGIARAARKAAMRHRGWLVNQR